MRTCRKRMISITSENSKMSRIRSSGRSFSDHPGFILEARTVFKTSEHSLVVTASVVVVGENIKGVVKGKSSYAAY